MNPRSEKFEIPDGLNADTVARLERIRVMARERILDFRARKRAGLVPAPAKTVPNPRGCPTD